MSKHKLTTKEFVQTYIHGCYDGLTDDEIAKRMCITIQRYRDRLKKAKESAKELGVELPVSNAYEEVPF